MTDLTTCSLLLILFLLLLWGGKLTQDKVAYQSSEKFRNQEPTKGNPFAHLLGMNRYRDVKDGECCDVWPAGPIVPATCNRVPLYPDGLEPTRDIPDEVAIPEAPFDRLAPKDGKFTFGIPELRYDGIWTKRANAADPAQCCWTLAPPKNCELKTYGASHLSRIPKCSMFGKTIVAPPECAGLWPGGPPPITLIYDCHENVPCSVRRNIPCPTRV